MLYFALFCVVCNFSSVWLRLVPKSAKRLSKRLKSCFNAMFFRSSAVFSVSSGNRSSSSLNCLMVISCCSRVFRYCSNSWFFCDKSSRNQYSAKQYPAHWSLESLWFQYNSSISYCQLFCIIFYCFIVFRSNQVIPLVQLRTFACPLFRESLTKLQISPWPKATCSLAEL